MLHIGGGYMVSRNAVVAILNLDRPTAAQTAFLKNPAQRERQVRICDRPRSAVICESRLGRRMYLSPISPGTLARRAAEDGMRGRHIQNSGGRDE